MDWNLLFQCISWFCVWITCDEVFSEHIANCQFNCLWKVVRQHWSLPRHEGFETQHTCMCAPNKACIRIIAPTEGFKTSDHLLCRKQTESQNVIAPSLGDEKLKQSINAAFLFWLHGWFNHGYCSGIDRNKIPCPHHQFHFTWSCEAWLDQCRHFPDTLLHCPVEEYYSWLNMLKFIQSNIGFLNSHIV